MTPQYLDEVAALHSPRALRDWIKTIPISRADRMGIGVAAGSPQAIRAIQGWSEGRKLTLTSVAASAMIGDLCGLATWMRCDLYLNEPGPPDGIPTLEELPWKYEEVLEIMDEFRAIALPHLGADWVKGLPGIPMGKAALRGAAGNQQMQMTL